jgi:peptide/nickel transport system ATP-binding protein
VSDAPRGEPLLAVEDLSVVFRTDKERIHAIDDVTFDIQAGETVGLVGESGSGKSVTARSILGLVDDPGRIESGSIYFRGEDLTEIGWEDARGDIAIVFQDPSGSLNPVYTVGNQIREALRIHQGLTGSAARDEAVNLLETVGISDAEKRVNAYPNEFSGGMRQRAVIATALACDPELLVCDEPTTALDVTIQAQILDVLGDLQREADLSILFITHDMGVISEVADRVNVMYAGEVVERAPADRLFSDPAHPYTRGLLASIPSVRDSDDQLLTVEGEVPTSNEAPTSCRFASRCPKAFDECTQVHPDRIDLGGGQSAACLLFDDELNPPVTPESGLPGAADAGEPARTDGGEE